MIADGARLSKGIEHVDPLLGDVEFEEAVFRAVSVVLCLLPQGQHVVILLTNGQNKSQVK